MAFYTQRGFVSLWSSSRLGNRYSIVSARWTATRGAFTTCVLSSFVRCRRLWFTVVPRDALNFHPVSPCALRSRSGHACLCRTCRGRFALIELMVAERRCGRRSRRAESEKMARRRSCSSVRPARRPRLPRRPLVGAGWLAGALSADGMGEWTRQGQRKDRPQALYLSLSPPFF